MLRCSQEPVLDVMAPRLVQHWLNAAVGWELKCWKMKEIVDDIKNVISNKARETVDATLTGLTVIYDWDFAFKGPCELMHAKGGPTPKQNCGLNLDSV